MRRRNFITLLGGAAAWPLAARAQQRGQVARIGMLETTSRESNATNLSGFQKGLRELGHVEGQNLLFEYRSADGRTERFPALAAGLVDLKVDVIVTRGTSAALAARSDRVRRGRFITARRHLRRLRGVRSNARGCGVSGGRSFDYLDAKANLTKMRNEATTCRWF